MDCAMEAAEFTVICGANLVLNGERGAGWAVGFRYANCFPAALYGLNQTVRLLSQKHLRHVWSCNFKQRTIVMWAMLAFLANRDQVGAEVGD
jgi:hypothetical protein